jgi:hypothetical protein
MEEKMISERYIVFMDVLGFSKTVMETDKADKIIKALREIKDNQKEMAKEVEDDELQITWFSDSIVISYPAYTLINLEMLIRDVQLIQQQLLAEGILMRGGITVGEFIHDNEIVYGKAFVEAYKLESKSAISPRVVISQQVLKMVEDAKMLEEKNGLRNLDFALKNMAESTRRHRLNEYANSKTTTEIIYDMLKKDKDGLYFIDYLKDFFACFRANVFEKENDISKQEDLCNLEYYEIIEPIILLIIKNLKNLDGNNDMSVIVKYLWLKEYFNIKVETAGRYMSKSIREKYYDKLYIKN